MDTKNQENLSIKSWSLEDRPREKLYHKGREALSNAELVAILLGSGSRNETAVSLAKRVLASVDNDLNRLGKLELEDLMKFKGIGEAKAITVAASLELGRRRKMEVSATRPKIVLSNDVYSYMASRLQDLPHEEFHVIYLNRRNEIIKDACISRGGVSATLVDPKIVFKKALQLLASSLILVHNHPSEGASPSNSDIKLTKKLQEGAKLLDISVLDHVIIAGKTYHSFADEGMI